MSVLRRSVLYHAARTRNKKHCADLSESEAKKSVSRKPTDISTSTPMHEHGALAAFRVGKIVARSGSDRVHTGAHLSRAYLSMERPPDHVLSHGDKPFKFLFSLVTSRSWWPGVRELRMRLEISLKFVSGRENVL